MSAPALVSSTTRPRTTAPSSSSCLPPRRPQALDPANLAAVYLVGDDADAVHEVIIKEMTRAIDSIAPIKLVAKKRRPAPLHLARDTLAAMDARDCAARCKDPTYRRLRNAAARLVRRDRARSSKDAVAQCNGDMYKLWALVNSYMGKTSSDNSLPGELEDAEGNTVKADIMNKLNAFYINKVEKIRERFNSTGSNIGTSASIAGTTTASSSFDLTVPSVSEVKKLLAGLSSTRAVAGDGIPTSVWKAAAPIVAEPIRELVAVSFRTGVVPAAFKMGEVVPIHKGKGKSRRLMNSYRPVTILPALSKVLEGAVLARLAKYLDGILPPEQHGFRAGRSTAEAVGFAHGSWSAATSLGRAVIIAAFDFSAAFDTIDPVVLVDKLRGSGVGGRTAKWLTSYLVGREQRLRANGSISNAIPVRFGVPQGSLLGPVLFVSLVADLTSALASADVGDEYGGSVSYADDVVAWSSGHTIKEARERLEKKADALCKYSTRNCLALNGAKTQILWAGKGVRAATSADLAISVGDSSVMPSHVLEVLGVQFDDRLRAKPYLESQTKAAKAIRGAMKRLSFYLPKELLGAVARPLLVGKVGYAAAATYPARLSIKESLNSDLQKLQAVVNDVARTVLGKRKTDRTPTEELLAASSIPSMNRLAVERAAVEIWKAAGQRSLPYTRPLSRLFGDSTTRSTRSAAAGLLRPRSEVKTQTMVELGVAVWNDCAAIRGAGTLSAAKKAAKLYSKSVPL